MQYLPVAETGRLTLFRDVIHVYSENHTKRTNILFGPKYDF
jgi:hypothetical protein